MILTKVDIAGLIVVGLLLVWQDAHSADVVMHWGSKHFGSGVADEQFNERNLGIGVVHNISRSFSMRGGIYDNSYNRNSVYLGGDLYMVHRYFTTGVQAGIATGYAGTQQGSGGVTPYLMPYIGVGTRTVKAEIGCLPPINGIGALTLSVKVRL